MNEEFKNSLIQDKTLAHWMIGYYYSHIYIPRILVKKILHILRANPPFIFLGENCIGGRLRSKKMISDAAVLQEMDDRLEDSYETFQECHNALIKADKDWHEIGMRCIEPSYYKNLSFDRMIYYAEQHDRYWHVLKQETDQNLYHKKVFDHAFSCVKWIDKTIGTTWFNPKYSNTYFLSKISLFDKKIVTEESMKYISGVFKAFDKENMDYLAVICMMARIEMMHCLQSIRYNRLAKFLPAKTELGFKEFVLDNIDDLLFEQHALKEEKYELTQMKKDVEIQMYKKEIMGRLREKHLSYITWEIQ